MKSDTQNNDGQASGSSVGQQQLVSHHWTKGGSGITNFDPEKEPMYVKAIEKYGDKNIVVSRCGMAGYPQSGVGYFSLHCLDRLKDMSNFWKVFRKLNG